MTNREVIQLAAKMKPELIMEIFDNMYCAGWNDGVRSAKNPENDPIDTSPTFDTYWLEGEWDDRIWRKSDIGELRISNLCKEDFGGKT